MKRIFFGFLMVAGLVGGSFQFPVSANAAKIQAVPAWEFLNEDDGIKVWRKEIPGSDVVAFRGEGVINAPISKVISVFYDTDRKKEWVAKIEEAKNVEVISDVERIEYNQTQAPWPIRNRDFVFHAKVTFDLSQQRMFIRMKSVEHAKVPPRKGVIRGAINESEYILTSIENGTKTFLRTEIHADPKGSIPKWVVNLFQKSWPHKTIMGIRSQVAKADVPVHANTQMVFEGKLKPPSNAVELYPAKKPVLPASKDPETPVAKAATAS